MDICTSARKTVPAGALNKSTGDAGIWSADTGVWEASSDCLPYVTGTASEPLQALMRMDVSKVIKDGPIRMCDKEEYAAPPVSVSMSQVVCTSSDLLSSSN